MVTDADVVKPGRKYTIHTCSGDFILADNKSRNRASVYFDKHFSGYTVVNGQVQADLSAFKTGEYLHRRNKGIYRLKLDQNHIVVVEDGPCQYRVFQTYETPSPVVDLAEVSEKKRGRWSWRTWAASVATHLLLIVCLSYMDT